MFIVSYHQVAAVKYIFGAVDSLDEALNLKMIDPSKLQSSSACVHEGAGGRLVEPLAQARG